MKEGNCLILPPLMLYRTNEHVLTYTNGDDQPLQIWGDARSTGLKKNLGHREIQQFEQYTLTNVLI
jgi:hypothetical protein